MVILGMVSPSGWGGCLRGGGPRSPCATCHDEGTAADVPGSRGRTAPDRAVRSRLARAQDRCFAPPAGTPPGWTAAARDEPPPHAAERRPQIAHFSSTERITRKNE